MKNGDKPIAPCETDDNQGFRINHAGLTKREYLAAMAMQGLMSNPNSFYTERSHAAEDAVDLADALLKTLEE